MRAFLFFISLFFTLLVVAQQPEKVIGAAIDTNQIVQPTAPVITTKPAQTDTLISHKHSPKTATLLSLALPGAGQVYNRKNWWWKVPIIYGGGAALVYGAVFYNKNYKDFKSAYEFSVLNPGVPTGDIRYDQYQDPATLLIVRDSYRDARDLCYIGLGLLYTLQVVDAAVEAHFFDFNVSDDLSLNIQPQFVMNGPMNYNGVLLTFKF